MRFSSTFRDPSAGTIAGVRIPWADGRCQLSDADHVAGATTADLLTTRDPQEETCAVLGATREPDPGRHRIGNGDRDADGDEHALAVEQVTKLIRIGPMIEQVLAEHWLGTVPPLMTSLAKARDC